jgi:glycosyltransferase 2 family protein
VSRGLKLGASVAVSLLFVWFSLRGKDLGEVWQQLRTANYLWLLAYFPLLLVIHLVRTVRWGLLIEPLAHVPFRRLNAVSAVGFMALVILPLRLGEFARPYLIRTPGKVRATSAMASVVVERVLDGLMVAMLLVILLLRVPLSGPNIERVRAGGYTMFGFFLALLAFLVLAYWQHGMALRLARATIGRVSPAICERLCTLLDAFIGGLKALPSFSRLLGIVALTALYWGINAFGMGMLARAFDIHLSLVESCTVLGVLVIGVMLPAGPGMAGTFQFFCQLGLSLFMPQTDVARATAAAYANVLWGAQFVQQVGLGLIFLAFFSKDLDPGHRVTFGELMKAEEAVEHESPVGSATPDEA